MLLHIVTQEKRDKDLSLALSSWAEKMSPQWFCHFLGKMTGPESACLCDSWVTPHLSPGFFLQGSVIIDCDNEHDQDNQQRSNLATQLRIRLWILAHSSCRAPTERPSPTIAPSVTANQVTLAAEEDFWWRVEGIEKTETPLMLYRKQEVAITLATDRHENQSVNRGISRGINAFLANKQAYVN